MKLDYTPPSWLGPEVSSCIVLNFLCFGICFKSADVVILCVFISTGDSGDEVLYVRCVFLCR